MTRFFYNYDKVPLPCLTRQISNARTVLSTCSCGVRPLSGSFSSSVNHSSSPACTRVRVCVRGRVHSRVRCVCVRVRVCVCARARAVAVALELLDGPVHVALQALGDELALPENAELHMTMFIKAHENHWQRNVHRGAVHDNFYQST